MRSNKYSSTIVGAVIHSDVCWKLPVIIPAGSEYFVTLIGEESRYVTVQLVAKKSDVNDVFTRYHA